MYITTFIPTKENHSIDIPEEFYGQKINVIAEAIPTSDVMNEAQKISEIDEIFSKYKRVDMSKFIFSRDEANNFDV